MAGLGVTLNGEDRQLPDGLTVSGLLEHLRLAGKPCAVDQIDDRSSANPMKRQD